MSPKFITSLVFFHFIFQQAFGFGAGKMSDADGLNFLDTFKRFEPTQWILDRGIRHCASPQCMYATRDNLNFLTNPPKESQEQLATNELTISMRNDCKGDRCCTDSHCTSYTSGQITSEHLYTYGSFNFMLRTAQQIQDFKVESTTFKSVKCNSSPSAEGFPHALSATPTRGYCMNYEADLLNFSSNRDLCQGVGRSVCAKYSWDLNTLSPGTYMFKAASFGWDCNGDHDFMADVRYEQREFDVNYDSEVLIEHCKSVCNEKISGCVAFAYQKHATQKICAFYTEMGTLRDTRHHEGAICSYRNRAIDYDTSAIYVDGKLVASGGRALLQDFDVTFEKHGRHTVHVYGYEDCCAGNKEEGYLGWTLGKSKKHKDNKRDHSSSSSSGNSSPSNSLNKGHGSDRGSGDETASGWTVRDARRSTLNPSDTTQPQDITTQEPKYTTTERPHSQGSSEAGSSSAHASASRDVEKATLNPEDTAQADATTEEPKDNTTEEPYEAPGNNDGPGSGRTEVLEQQKKKAIPLIIDCDAGFDDSMGVVIAMHFHRLGKVNLKAVTLSNGNTQEDHPWNAMHVIIHEIFGQPDIPIYRMPPQRDEMVDIPFYGIDGHYGQVIRYMESYHGMLFPELNVLNSQQYLCQQLQLEPELVILVTGPLTNLHACHHLIKPTHRIFMMGGAIDVPGNVPAAYQAEFNFATNPDAVRDVISHGNSVIIPLDCKMRFFTQRVRDALKEKKNRFLIETFKRFTQQVYKAVNGKEYDTQCGDECISIYDAVASYVMHMVLIEGNIQLAYKSVDIDMQGAVIDGPYGVLYCDQYAFDPIDKLQRIRTLGTDTIIQALQAAVKDFNEEPPTVAPTFLDSRDRRPSKDLGSTGSGPGTSSDHTYHHEYDKDTPRYDDGGEMSDAEGQPWVDTVQHGARNFLPTEDVETTKRTYHHEYDKDMPRYDDGGDMSDAEGQPWVDPTEDVETTKEVTSTSGPSSTQASGVLTVYGGARLCIQLMRRVYGRYVNSILMRISMCFNSWNTRTATLSVVYNDKVWKRIVGLPHDASQQIGNYKIDWLPDRIAWKVDSTIIGEVKHGFIEIPDTPLHIKLFVAPSESNTKQDERLQEHQLHVYSSSYKKYDTDKTELFVSGTSTSSLVKFLLPLVMLTIAGLIFWKKQQIKNDFPDGYKPLQEDLQSIP